MSKKTTHRGEILRLAVTKVGYNTTKLCAVLGISRATIYNKYKEEFIPNDEMLKYGKVLGFDFSIYIPELADYSAIIESKEDFTSQKQYREKYYNLLEKHVKVLHELNLLRFPQEPLKDKKSKIASAPSETSAPKLRQKKNSK